MMFKLFLLLSILYFLFKHGICVEFSHFDKSKISWIRKLHFGDADANFPFRNKSLPIKDRVDDLVSRLTLEEVILQMARGGAGPNGPAPGIEKLGVNPYNWNNEGIHGYLSPKYSTDFPSPIGLAATFNKSAIMKMAQAVAVEARASYNMFLKEQNLGDGGRSKGKLQYVFERTKSWRSHLLKLICSRYQHYETPSVGSKSRNLW